MVKVKSITLNDTTKEAYVFLEADSKSEVTTDPTDAIGMPAGYTYAPFSKVMTLSREIGILGSDGTWKW